jgi:trehalose/maltose hydrolase-like predicted phosphorylase
MGGAILAVLYARLGDAEKSFQMFKKSYQPNELPPFNVLAETAGGTNPYFATGAGGMLQAVIFGIGGLEINDSGIGQLDTKLPKNWQSLKLTGIGKDRLTFERKN